MKDKTPDGTAVNDYGNLLGDMKERIRSAQYAAPRAVNRELIGLIRLTSQDSLSCFCWNPYIIRTAQLACLKGV